MPVSVSRGRETVERAYPGDVIGLPNPGKFAIGDTLYNGAPVRYPRVPRFPAEHFGRARLLDQLSWLVQIGRSMLLPCCGVLDAPPSSPPLVFASAKPTETGWCVGHGGNEPSSICGAMVSIS